MLTALFYQPVTVDPTVDTAGFLEQLWQAGTQHRWDILAVLATIGFVWAVRGLSPKVGGKFGLWIQSQRVSATLAILGGMATTIATTLLTGGRLTPKLLGAGFTAGIMASGGYNVFWDVFFPKPTPLPPFIPPGAPTPIPPPTSPPAATPPSSSQSGKVESGLLIALAGMAIGFALFVASCACLRPENAKNPGCKILDVVVTCSTQQLGPGFAALVAGVLPALSGQAIDWGAIATLEQQYGTQAVMCAVGEVGKLINKQGPLFTAHFKTAPTTVAANAATVLQKRRVIIASSP